ncbi:MAG: argininosuccinate lyase [Alphaproteobacteria bacterium]|nr:argininosuccinate lyase [Alphaproteobacteria bacterium]
MALWDGRFSGGPAEEMLRFGESLGTDLQMWREDIAGSKAHSAMLGAVGILGEAEVAEIHRGLDAVGDELAAAEEAGWPKAGPGWTPGIELEDVHMAVETRLHHHVGDVAGKLHTARSRNDQVATDVRLWLRGRIDLLDAELAYLIGILLDRVEQDGRVLVPGCTHLQRGQPVWLGHQILAHAWALSRDRERLADCRKRLNRSPLGAAAMAGTPHPIDRLHSAGLLGFSGVVENAMDAVSARDHVIEAVSACAIAMSHLSRMAEELVIWSTPEFRRVRLSDAWSTGSSIMPQKRNPDAPEIVRGKAGRVFGALQALLTLMKALPLAYNRDMQEDRPPLFDAVGTTRACVRVMAGCWAELTVLPGPDLTGDFLLTTELADHLAANGVPFRQAHHVAGSLVKACEERGQDLSSLTLDELRAAHPAFGDDALAWLEPTAAAERRTSRGGTAWTEVTRQVALLRATL